MIDYKRVIVALVRGLVKRRQKLLIDYNENHDEHGRFASSNGGG